jgi:transposase
MADLLRELGGEVKMANPVGVKAIAHARIKTDKRDSRTLAQLLRADLRAAPSRFCWSLPGARSLP